MQCVILMIALFGISQHGIRFKPCDQLDNVVPSSMTFSGFPAVIKNATSLLLILRLHIWRISLITRSPPVLSVLGVSFHVATPKSISLTKVSVAEITLVLNLFHCVAVTFRDRQKLLQSLILPKFTWAAGVAGLPEDQLLLVRKLMIKAFGGRVALHDSPMSIMLELMSWKLDPVCATNWAALRAACQFFTKPPRWVDRCSERFRPSAAFDLFPLAAQTLQRLGWRFDQPTAAILRVDSQGVVRRFCIGWDNPNVLILRYWLIEEHRRLALATCGRVRQSLHRPILLVLALILPLRKRAGPLSEFRTRCVASPLC